MKSEPAILGAGAGAGLASPLPELIAATSASLPVEADAKARARAFAEPLIASETLDTGENTLAHADAVARIVADIGGSEAMQAASYLVYACEHLNRPQDVITKAFGPNYAALAVETTQLVRVQRQARLTQASASGSGTAVPMAQSAAAQTENVRKMLLEAGATCAWCCCAWPRGCRRCATTPQQSCRCRPAWPASRCRCLRRWPTGSASGRSSGRWKTWPSVSWSPTPTSEVARLLDEKRVEREAYVEQLRQQLETQLRQQGVLASVQGRPKHIYSIVRKMRGKSLGFGQVHDIRALRVVVPTVADCYAALSWVHTQLSPVANEFDDYIARPKANGYQSLHTVVRNAQGQPIEVQIRTQAMHDHAEHGVAAHWAYKEAGSKGYSGVSASGEYDAKIAVLRQLLAWERDLSGSDGHQGLFDDRIYVLTPNAAIVELPQGATPVDFAYSVHTSLGHRCRGARVDGAMVPLNTPLQNGQTVEVSTVKEGGPSRDWLNAELGFLVSHRARAKVRAWFNLQQQHETTARGREAVEKLLQREGKTATKLEDLASQLGFKSADDLFHVVGKDEFSLRSIEALFKPAEPVLPQDEFLLLKKFRQGDKAASASSKGGVLVVGIDSLMTQLAKCCKPAPPDEILGFVTRGKGVSVHRADCSNFREMVARNGERVIEVEWGRPKGATDAAVYSVDVTVEAADRQGLLRDISEVFAREKMNVIGVQTQTVKGTAWMTFTVEVADAGRLRHVMAQVNGVANVRSTRRR